MTTPATMPLDHLVYAGPDLADAVIRVTELIGVAPVPGGSHVGLGTANYLVALGGRAYLEIVGPDPAQPDPERPRPLGIDTLDAPKLVAWSVRTPEIDQVIATARARGFDPGDARDVAPHRGRGAAVVAAHLVGQGRRAGPVPDRLGRHSASDLAVRCRRSRCSPSSASIRSPHACIARCRRWASNCSSAPITNRGWSR